MQRIGVAGDSYDSCVNLMVQYSFLLNLTILVIRLVRVVTTAWLIFVIFFFSFAFFLFMVFLFVRGYLVIDKIFLEFLHFGEVLEINKELAYN